MSDEAKEPCCERDHDKDGNCDRHPQKRETPEERDVRRRREAASGPRRDGPRELYDGYNGR